RRCVLCVAQRQFLNELLLGRPFAPPSHGFITRRRNCLEHSAACLFQVHAAAGGGMARRSLGIGFRTADCLATGSFVLDLPGSQLLDRYLPRGRTGAFGPGILPLHVVLADRGVGPGVPSSQDAAAVPKVAWLI